jgi:hypothetical protein
MNSKELTGKNVEGSDHSEVLSGHLPEGAKENRKKSQTSWVKIEPGTS